MSNQPLSYLTRIPDEPRETYIKRLVQQCREALIEHPEDELPLLRNLMIWLSVDNESDDETIGIAQRVLSLDTEKQYFFDAYFTLARIYSSKKETAKAVEFYKKTIEAKSDSEEPILELLKIYKEQKDWANALLTCDLLNNDAIEGGMEMMYRCKGDIYMSQKDWDNASKCFDKAIECCMQYEWVVRRIGRMHISKGSPDIELEYLKKELAEDSEKAETHCRLGLIYQDRDDYYLAMHHYTEALKLNAAFAEAYNNMALLVFEQEGDWRKSETLLRKAIEIIEEKISSDDANNNWNEWLIALFHLNLSRIYIQMTFFEKAARCKSKFIERMGFAISDDEEGEEEADY